MEDGWCDAFKVCVNRKGKAKRKITSFHDKKLIELEKVYCEMSGLVSPEMTGVIGGTLMKIKAVMSEEINAVEHRMQLP